MALPGGIAIGGGPLVNDDGTINVNITDPDSGVPVGINADGQMHIVAEGHLATESCSTTPLGAGATFVGEPHNILAYNAISLMVIADQDSAPFGLEVHFSVDAITWYAGESYTVKANTVKRFTPPAFGVYMRVSYTNGAIAQNVFDLMTIVRKVPIKWSSHNIDMPITDEDDAVLTKAVITGKRADGVYDNVALTNGNNAKISLEELESGVSEDNKTTLRVAPMLIDGEANIHRAMSDAVFPGVQIVGSIEHHEIHEGDHYYYCSYQTGVGAGTAINILLTTPNNADWVHLTFDFYSSLGATVDVYEGSSSNLDGTTITPQNNNRNSVNTASTTMRKDPTGIVDGTIRAGYLAGSSRGAGAAKRENELILKTNTTYLFRVTSSQALNAISWCFEFYEHVAP